MTEIDGYAALRRWFDAARGTSPAPAVPVRLRVRGAISRAPGSKWMAWEGEQVFDREGVGFRWRARIQVAPFVWVNAEDRLDAAGGYGGAKMFGVIPVGSARGPEVTRSQLVRNLAELAFVPGLAARAQRLVWTADGGSAVVVTAPGVDADASVRIEIDERGDVRSARSPDRPRETGRGGGFLHEPYRLEFDGHAAGPDGTRIPHRAAGFFETAAGDWPYWKYEVVDGG